MGAFNLSSNPLSTLFPNLSPQQDPNYGNAFQIDLGNLKSTTSPLPDYAKQFAESTQPMITQMKFKAGLATSGSSNPAIAFKGKQMVDGAIQDTFSSVFPTDGSGSGKPSFFSKIGGWQTVGAAADMLGSFMPEKDEYSGTKGDVAQSLDSAYNNISNTLMAIPGWGTVAGGIMKAGSFLSKGVNALGGGTDGMCVCAGTKVFKANGEIINIEDLKQEDGIIGWNERTKEIKPQAIHNFIEPRQKECVEIVLKNGYFIRCSIDHPILSDTNPKAKSKYINGRRIAVREWKFRRADELKVGDFVGLANNIDYWGNNHLDNAYLVGLLIGDGSYGKGASCRIISADQDTWKYLEDNNLGIINHCDDSRPEKYSKEIRTYRVIGGMELLHQLGISYQTGKNKTLPKNIGTFDKPSVCNLLAGLFDTDGSISVNEEKQTYSITLYQSNIDLLEEVRVQLHKLGIFSTIGTRKAAKYELGRKIINSNESYRLEIHDISSALKFCKLIPLNIFYKKENLGRIYDMLKDKKAQEHNDISGAKQCKIVSITPIGVQIVYNLQADYDHTYLANCIITHNTTTDAILGSSFLSLTPFGLINGFGGSKANTITKDKQVFETVGSSYTGTNQTVNDALTKSGKKYGLFSSKARDRANEEIEEAKRQQGVMSWVADEATDRFAIRNSMAAINGNRRKYYLQGGYNQADVRVGRSGMSLDLIAKAKKVLSEPRKLQTGGTAKDPFEYYVSTLPVAQRDSSNFRVRDYWQYNGQPKDFDEAKKKGMFSFNQKDNSYHARSVAENPQTGDIEFMKSSNHPTIFMETDWYENGLIHNDNGTTVQLRPGIEGYENWQDFKNNYELQRTEPYWKYVRRKKDTPSHKEGGQMQIKTTEILIVEPELIEDRVDLFKDGGTINIIPEGALHAHKHNMDIEGITPKGIPVISNKEGGEVEQQAEIEREEIIFRLEVTKKLEELEKKFYDSETSQKEKDECALEAGKLLVEEILYNTQDNTNKLL